MFYFRLCPVCGDSFPNQDIEVHAATCGEKATTQMNSAVERYIPIIGFDFQLIGIT